jgi:hypothetical protein
VETITVYKVRLYDARNDESFTSRRMATIAGAGMMGGWIIDGTGIEIEPSQLEPGMQWTARDFNPRPRRDFQTQVTS